MRLEVLKHLHDMQQACLLLSSFLAGKSLADYQSDALLRSAVERQLTIVGEAMTRLGKIDRDVMARITDARRIVAFRNILVHGYDVIDEEIVWGILESNLPTLKDEVAVLLEEGQCEDDQADASG